MPTPTTLIHEQTHRERDTFEHIYVMWQANPDVTYGELADALGLSEFEVMGIIQRHVEHLAAQR